MALRFSKHYTSEVEMIYDAAKSSQLYSQLDYDNWKADKQGMEYLYSVAGTLDLEKPKSFDDAFYKGLSREGKLQYITNEYYVDREKQVDGLNVYDTTSEFLKQEWRFNQDAKFYESLNGLEKAIHSVGGLTAGAVAELWGTLQGMVAAGAFLYQAGSELFTGADSESSKKANEFVKSDFMGYNKLREGLDTYYRRYTFLDKNAIVSTAQDVLNGIVRMTPMIATGGIGGAASTLGSVAYYGASAGNSVQEIYNEHPNADTKSVFGYAAFSTGLELLIEGMSDKIFKAPNIIDKMTYGATKSFAGASTKHLVQELGMSFLTEGLEEMVSEILDPMLYKAIIDEEADLSSIEDILYAGLVGGLIGFTMTGGNILGTKKQSISGIDKTVILDKQGNVVEGKFTAEEMKKKGYKLHDVGVGTLVDTKLANKIGIDNKIDLGRFQTRAMNQMLAQAVKIETSEIGKLLKENPNKTWNEIKELHPERASAAEYTDTNNARLEAIVALSKLLDEIGFDKFTGAVERFTRFAEVENANAEIFIEANTVGRDFNAQRFQELLNTLKFEASIVDPSSPEMRNLVNNLKKDYKRDVLVFRGNIGIEGASLVEGTILVNENVLRNHGLEGSLLVIKEELSHDLQRTGTGNKLTLANLEYIDNLIKTEATTPLPEFMKLNLEGRISYLKSKLQHRGKITNENIDVQISKTVSQIKADNAQNPQTKSDLNNLYALRDLFRPIGYDYDIDAEYFDGSETALTIRAEQQAKKMAETILFDGMTVDRMFNTNKGLFNKIYIWMKNKANHTYKGDDVGKLKFQTLQQQMSLYRDMMAANAVASEIIANQTELGLTDNQVALMNRVTKKHLVEHYGFLSQDYTFDERNKSEAINTLMYNTPEGTQVDFFRFGDPSYYDKKFVNMVNEIGGYKLDDGNYDFERNINVYLADNYNLFIHYPTMQLMKIFNFYDMMDTGVLEDSENLSTHEFIKKYPNTLNLFSEKTLNNIMVINGKHPFEANLIASNIEQGSNVAAWYDMRTGNIHLPISNKVKMSSIIHELIHHQSRLQGLSDGSNPTAIRAALTGDINKKHLKKLIDFALDKDFVNNTRDANKIFDALAYWIYIKTSGEINANMSTSTLSSGLYGDFNMKLKGFAMTSGFDSINGVLKGFGKLKGVDIDLRDVGGTSGLTTTSKTETDMLMSESVNRESLSGLWSKSKGFNKLVDLERQSESKIYNDISEIYNSPLGKEFSPELEDSLRGVRNIISIDRLKQLINSNNLGSEAVANAVINKLYPNNKNIKTIEDIDVAQQKIPQLMFLKKVSDKLGYDFDVNKSYTIAEIFDMVEDVYKKYPKEVTRLTNQYNKEFERYDKLKLDEKNSGEVNTWFLNNDFNGSYSDVQKLLNVLRGVGLVSEKGLGDFYITTSDGGERAVTDYMSDTSNELDNVLSESDNEVKSYEDRLFESVERTKDKAELENQYKMLNERKEATLELLRQDYKDSELSKAEIEVNVNETYEAVKKAIEDTGAIDMETYKGSASERTPLRQKIWRLRKQIAKDIDVNQLNSVESRILNADHNEMSLKELGTYVNTLEALRKDAIDKYKETSSKVDEKVEVKPKVEEKVKAETKPVEEVKVEEKTKPVEKTKPIEKVKVEEKAKVETKPVEKTKTKSENKFDRRQNKVLDTTYDQTAITQVQKVDDANQENYVVRTREHLDSNKTYYDNLTDVEAQKMIETWDNSAIGDYTPNEYDLRRTNMTIFLMHVINNAENFDATTVAMAKETLAKKLSWAAKDLALWSRVFERATRLETGLKDFKEKFGKDLEGITTEDVKEYNKAVKDRNFAKVMEMERVFIKKVTEQAPKNEYNIFTGTLAERYVEFKRLMTTLHGFRYMAMLTNPATHMRNYLSNVGMKLSEKSTNALTKLFEKIIPREKGQYKYFTNQKISPEVEAYVKSIEKTFEYLLAGGKYEMTDGSLTWKMESATKYNNPALRKLSELIYNSLEGNDIKFIIPSAMNNLMNLMEANNITPADMDGNKALFGELVENAVWRASKQYLKAQNNFSKVWKNIASKNIFLDIVMGTILPFPKIAYNITQQIFEHSPAAIAKGLYKLVQAKTNPQVLADNPFFRADTANLLAKGSSGTLLMITGLILAQLGLLKFDEDDKFSGVVLNIGEFKVRLSDIAPSISPMLIGAALSSRSASDTRVVERFTSIIGEQTLIGSFDELFGYGRTIWDLPINAIETYMLQYVPAIMKTTAKAFDNNVKKYDQAWYRVFQKIAAGIPGLSYVVPNKVNPYTGEPAKRYGHPILAFLNIASPISINSVKKDNVRWEAERLDVKTTGANGNFKVNDTDIKLKGRALEEFSSKRGEYIQKEGSKFLNDSMRIRVRVDNEDGSYTYKELMYSEMDDTQRANALSGIYTSATNYAKINYWTSQGNTYISTSLIEFDKLREYGLRSIRYIEGYNRSKFIK